MLPTEIFSKDHSFWNDPSIDQFLNPYKPGILFVGHTQTVQMPKNAASDPVSLLFAFRMFF